MLENISEHIATQRLKNTAERLGMRRKIVRQYLKHRFIYPQKIKKAWHNV